MFIVLFLLLTTPLDETGAAPALAARHSFGVVTADELADWQRYQTLKRGRERRLKRREEIEDLALVQVLATRAREAGLDRGRNYEIRLQHLERKLAEQALRQALRHAAEPSAQEIEAAHRAAPEQFHRPRRWRLENIFKKLPPDASDAARDTLRAAMETIRARALAGESFQTLARRESESATRLRGGAMGIVTLDRLTAQVAEVVEKLKQGAISPVIETAEGFTLLHCTKILPAEKPGFAEVRQRLARQLHRQRIQQGWDEEGERLLAAAAPSYFAKRLTADAAPDTVLATFHDGTVKKQIVLDSYLYHLGRVGVRQDAVTLGEAEHRTHLETLVLEAVRTDEAARRGLLATPEHQLRRRFEILELQAQLAVNQMAEARIETPTDEEMRTFYGRRHDELRSPRRRLIRALEIDIEQNRPADFYTRLEKIGELLAAGKMEFKEAAAALARDARPHSYGWLTDKQLWLLGLNIDTTVNQLEPGASSAAVQEGTKLYLLNLLAVEAERQLSYEEARPRIEAALMAARRREAGKSLREDTLRSLDIELLPTP